ncbi:MAG: sensor histidine kinase [Leifsonia sp.]
MPMSTRSPHPGAEWRGGPPWARWLDEDRPRRRVRWFPIVFSQIVQLPVLLWLIATRAPVEQLVASLVALAASYLLLAVPRYPGPSVVAIAVAVAPAVVLVSGGPPLAAVPLAFAVAEATARGARAWVWGTIATGAVVAVAYGSVTGSWPAIVRSLIVLIVLSLVVGLGEGIRSRADRYREYRETQVRRRQSEAEQERLRIARELHDVLAHSLSSINVQAGMGLHLIDERPEKAAEALANIKETSKSALDEVRGVLGFLRSDDGGAPLVPEPELGRLPALAASLTALGVSVSLVDELAPGTPMSSERTIYRIVQESLTNVTRHSEATEARVRLWTDGDDDVVEVTDNGTGDDSAIVEGRGVTGMRERAQILGGTVSVRRQEGGGVQVQARIPRRSGRMS